MDGEKVFPLPARDPVSGGSLVITELVGPDTGITIRGRFEMPRFAQLSADQARYLETFLRCRGMLNSVEKELGISYPTARARLDAVLRALDLHAVREDSSNLNEDAEAPAIAAEVSTIDLEEPSWVAAEEEPATQEPVEEVPFYEEPVAQEPAAPEHIFEKPAFEEPSEQPVPEEPVFEAPEEEPVAVPRRSRDEILTLLERGEITPEAAKKELTV